MVDLVKIRKKAKEKKESQAAGRGSPEVETLRDAERRAADDKRQAADDQRQAADDQRRAADDKRRAADDQRQVASDQRQAADDQRQAANDQRQAANDEPPVPADEPPPAGGRETTKLERFIETAGQRRATKKAGAIEPVRAHLELLSFEIAGEHYAIDIDSVVEIVTSRPVTRIPNADPSIVGILSLRGMIVTLIDVRRRLGHAPGDGSGPDVRVIVVQRGGETAGFIVDRVQRVVKVDAESVEPHPVVHDSELDDSVRGVFRYSGTLTMLLDLEKLLGGVAAWN